MRYTAEQIQDMADEVRVLGYTVLEGALPPDRVAVMRSRFDELLAETADREETNRGPARYQMYLPWAAPFTDPALFENEAALAVVEAVLGADPALVYFASDTPLPGSDYQRVHSDTRPLFPDAQFAPPAYGLALNAPLVDCTEENGSLEFWPGTHLCPPGSNPEALAPRLPSRRANLKAGSLLLRDLRMWHRGTPNRSKHSRPHLALVYTRPWYRFEQQVPRLSRAAYAALSERARRLLRFANLHD